MLLTATCGSTAPGIVAMSTRRAAAFTPVRVITGWRASGASLMPAVITAPPGASATPETSSDAAVPNGRTWCQVRPSAEANAVRFRPAWPVTPVSPASTAPSGPPLAIRAVNPAGAPRVAWNVQARPFGEEKTSTAGRLATVAGRSRTNPWPTAATPATCGRAPCPVAAPDTGAQVAPPSALSQATPAWTVVVRLGLLVTASPEIRISWPTAATDVMSRAWPLPAARRSRAASSRSQLVPLADRKISGVDLAACPPGLLAPTAMKPCAVLATALIRSPGRSGIPLPGASVQVRPSGLVQIEPGPRATQAPWVPATKMAPCPGGGTPPTASLTAPSVQVRPSSPDTKNCARGMRVPACDPTATISCPTLATRPRVWVMPRPLPAAVKSLPASVAGGKPSEAADGAGPAWPLFAPAITTTATPKTTMARIGIATLIPQPRNSRPFTNSRAQRRLTGWGSSERSRPAHSAPAARPAPGPSGRRPDGWPGIGPGSGPDGCADGGIPAPGADNLPNSNPGGTNTSSGQACGGACIEAGWLTVGVYRNRRGWPGWAGGVWPGGILRVASGEEAERARGGRGRRYSNSNPGAVPLHGSSSG